LIGQQDAPRRPPEGGASYSVGCWPAAGELNVTLNLDGGPASPHQYLERDTRMGQIITDTYMVWEYETNLKSARAFA